MPAPCAATRSTTRRIPSRPVAILIALTLLFWAVPPACGHPHVFIDVRIEVALDDQGIQGIWQHWTFDEYFSAWVIEEFDADGDGKFSGDELAVVQEESFAFIANFGYFTKVLVGEREIPVRHIEHFSVAIAHNRAIYAFFVPLNITIDAETPPVRVAVYDESFYCHVFFPKEETRFKGDVQRWQVRHSTLELPELTYYYGLMTPTAVLLSLSAP